MYANCSAVLDMLINLFLNRCSRHSRLPPRKRNVAYSRSPSFEIFRPFRNRPLARTSYQTPRFPIHFTSFDTLWPQKSDHSSLIYASKFHRWNSYVNRHGITYHYYKEKVKISRVQVMKGCFVLLKSAVLFNDVRLTFEMK
jgi:hypothetical protein